MNRSPFPGMDPYLESRWPEVHARLIVYSCNQINRNLPDDLRANIEESLTVYRDGERSGIRPDVHVSQDEPLPLEIPFSDSGGNQAALAEPILIPRLTHETRHIEIVDSDGEVITAIEFVSPWNTVGIRNREAYARKQMDYLTANINLVEIDLVRQGQYVLAASYERIPVDVRAPYLICVSRCDQPEQFELYPAPIQSALPNIPVPLRTGERDVPLVLQDLVDDCYRDGRYHRIDYQNDPDGCFDESVTAWIDERLKSEGRRA